MFCEVPQFGRCCFCLPLRRGILVFGYLNAVFTAFMIGVYSYSIHEGTGAMLLYHGTATEAPEEMGLFMYCLDLVFSVILLYGAHQKIVRYIKIAYYFMVLTVVASVVIKVLENFSSSRMPFIEEVMIFGFAGLCVQLYLIFLVKSLLKKLEESSPHMYENQLHQIVNGEIKIESNGVYNSSTVPIDQV